MDQTPPVPPPPGTSLFEMDIDGVGQNHLNTISKWGKFIAITGLVIVAICLLGLAVSYQEIAEQIGKMFAFDNNAAGILIAILVIIGGLGVLLLISLLRACILIKRGLIAQNADHIADGFKSMKAVFTISIIFSALNILGVIFNLINS